MGKVIDCGKVNPASCGHIVRARPKRKSAERQGPREGARLQRRDAGARRDDQGEHLRRAVGRQAAV